MEKRSSFSGSIGFVLAAAGSAVGLGNIWRFPYLAAKDGGGLFLVIYIILALTFGFTLLMTEVSIGRKTKQSCLTAYGKLHKNWGFLGVLASIVPFIIMPYYCVIGGWVLKYSLVFITGQGAAAAGDDFFTNFITGYADPIIYNLIFLLMTAFVIFRGVNKGIEALSKVLMPILFVLIIGIAVYALTLTGSEESGGRTGLQGMAIYVIPNLEGVGVRDVLMTIMDAMGQLFYSISVAMGIMVTYGSYYKDKDNLLKSVNQIELFDTIVAFLAGVMIIPAVYVFLGPEGLSNAGPSLLFVAMPKIFAQMGVAGNILGAVFFLTVLFAALTSCISIMEAICSGMIDKGMSRPKATIVEGVIALVLSTVVCLGYNALYFEFKLPNGTVGQILDIMDYLSNNVLMPILAIGTCILIGWVVKPKTVIDEATKNGETFHRRWLYIGMIKVVAPALLLILLLGSLGVY
ncbi:sodium-dependent transporter [Ruminococcus sp.]|uniref:sodium-dependent transporter n=1 Tax=Ruminococcus sp. TaxID=41978 RepID=UPI003891076F